MSTFSPEIKRRYLSIFIINHKFSTFIAYVIANNFTFLANWKRNVGNDDIDNTLQNK